MMRMMVVIVSMMVIVIVIVMVMVTMMILMMVTMMILTHPNERPHHSFSLHPLLSAVDHEEQKHEEHHEVEDQNEHCQQKLLQSQPP